MKQHTKRFLFIFSITLLIGIVLLGIFFGGAVLGYWGNVSSLSIDDITMQQSSSIVYTDSETGEEKELYRISASENRIWVDLDNIPKNMQNAFIAIEDERFYEHNGVDFRRTIKATFTWFADKLTGKSGGATLGGSTITQQMIKNVSGQSEQTVARKFKEIASAFAIEREMEKDQILEAYLNCIYLSQGCNGVQTASRLYFGKDVSQLSLAECASIAGITKYPSLYDPFVNPEKNKERQEIVLRKMLELEYISQDDYDNAVAEELAFTEPVETSATSSYFVDQVIRDVIEDLKAQGHSEEESHQILYSEGVIVHSTYVPQVQDAMESYYTNIKNFPDQNAQSAMAIVNVHNGQVVGLIGGIGEKTGSLVLNRAASTRQPGSTIKPIAVYAPAIDKGLITAGSIFEDKPITYGEWSPRNYDHSFRGSVDIRQAVRSSLNTIPVQVLEKLGVDTSYNFLKDKLGITTLVEMREGLSDKGYAQLALGGLTDGVTAIEMSAAFAAFANNGVYHAPHTYTHVTDKDGNVILESKHNPVQAMKPSTAYIMSRLLQEVVTSGTGGGASLSGGMFTAGKTGTTTDNNDRWFIGYTPYYSAAVWYGYDIPRQINVSSNPCIPVFRNVMNNAHKGLDSRKQLSRPSNIVSISYCTYSGMRATEECPSSSYYYYSKDNIPAYCSSGHEGYVDPDAEEETDEETEETEENENAAESNSSGETSGNSSEGSTTNNSTTNPAELTE